MITIMNLREINISKSYDVKIDRSSILGNPFNMKSEMYRQSVCDQYYYWFQDQIKQDNIPFGEELDRLLALYKKHGYLRLFCWCAPLKCHGETIKEWLEEYS